MENAQTVPKWMMVYLWILTIITLLFSVMAYLKPEIQFAQWSALGTAGALSLAGPLGLYVARNLATVATGVFALRNKSVNAVMAAFVLRAATDGMDFIHNLIGNNLPIAIFALVVFVIEITALFKLNK